MVQTCMYRFTRLHTMLLRLVYRIQLFCTLAYPGPVHTIYTYIHPKNCSGRHPVTEPRWKCCVDGWVQNEMFTFEIIDTDAALVGHVSTLERWRHRDFNVPKFQRLKIKLKLLSLLFAIGAVFKTPQSNSEMHAAMPRAARRPTVHWQVQKVPSQKIQKFQKIPSLYY